jgi:hypothetical protein
MALATPRFGFAIPVGGGAAARDTSFVWDLGGELHAKSVDVVGGVGAFATLRVAAAGGSEQFHEALGRTSRSGFGYTRLTAGIVFGGQFQLLVTRTLGGPSALKDVGTEISFTIVQGSKAPKPEAAPEPGPAPQPEPEEPKPAPEPEPPQQPKQ